MKRRSLIKNSLMTSMSLLALHKVSAEDLTCVQHLTPKQAKGPFYPVIDQIDKDADLVQFQGQEDAPIGQVVIIQGYVTDQNCQPVKNALVEIWQACASGKYNHPSDPNTAVLDPNFQYWGQSATNDQGFYKFRTIIPGAYPADTNWIRPPHIHFKVAKLGFRELITQMYFANQALNERDLILQGLSTEDQKKVVVEINYDPSLVHPIGQFDIQIQKIN